MKKEDKQTIFGTVSTEEAITLLQRNGDENVTIIIKSVHQGCATLCDGEQFMAGLMPERLQKMIKANEAFAKAFERGFLSVEDGKITSHFESKCMLAYFCGRVFCGDYTKITRGYSYWKKGCGKFPEKSINQLFGVAYLREIRNKYTKKRKIFEGFEVVDSLFVV